MTFGDPVPVRHSEEPPPPDVGLATFLNEPVDARFEFWSDTALLASLPARVYAFDLRLTEEVVFAPETNVTVHSLKCRFGGMVVEVRVPGLPMFVSAGNTLKLEKTA